ncbi:hypothetical protein CI41S_50530 [Bradyrhizobium ivorense]|nr:hypothetical protein CI41S_50530 [Bradyrhizobium ivorense]
MQGPGQSTADAIDDARIVRASEAICTMTGNHETELNETRGPQG